MRRCGFVLENGDHCYQRTKVRYPGNDPENGPAREYCEDGHSTCYVCAKWFQAIVKFEAWTDEETLIHVPASTHEADWCSGCEQTHLENYCTCGQDKKHTHTVVLPDDGDELSWACCGSMMCCVKGNE